MAENLSSIYVARLLHQSDLYYFSASLLADLLDLDKRQAYRLLARLKAEGLVDEVEKGKYLLLGLEPERVTVQSGSCRQPPGCTTGYVGQWSLSDFDGCTPNSPLSPLWTTPSIDVSTLIEYTNRMENKSLGSRLGYLLESLWLSHSRAGTLGRSGQSGYRRARA